MEILKRIRHEFDGTFALNAWVARAGRIASGDTVTLLDTSAAELPARSQGFMKAPRSLDAVRDARAP